MQSQERWEVWYVRMEIENNKNKPFKIIFFIDIHIQK